jgi:uncharacterized protein
MNDTFASTGQPAPVADPKHSPAGTVTWGRALAVTAAAALVLGIVVGPIINSHSAVGADTSGTPEHTVTVTGSGNVSLAPDVADVILGVSVTRPTVAEAQSAAGTAMTAVVAAIKKDGIADKDIVTVNLSLGAVYDYSGSSQKLVGYQFTNTVRVTVRNLKTVAAVVDDSVAAGATTISGISFRLGDPKTVEAQARQLAMNDARAKADALAGAAGVAVKGVASITESSYTPVTYYPAADKAASGASTPIQTGTTDVTVNVTVSYLIG